MLVRNQALHSFQKLALECSKSCFTFFGGRVCQKRYVPIFALKNVQNGLGKSLLLKISKVLNIIQKFYVQNTIICSHLNDKIDFTY